MSPRRTAAALVVLTLLIHLPALVHPEPIDDEAIYSVVANEIVAGGRPYVDAVERKPPALFYTYAAIFRVAGEFNWPALHLAAIAWVLFTMAGLYQIGRRLFDWQAGMAAALLYTVFQPWGTWKNLAFNGEMLMNLPIVLAWMIALRPGRPGGPGGRRNRPELILAGVLFCLAFLLKQPAAIAALPLPLYLSLPSYRARHGLSLRDSIAQCAMAAAGFCAALAVAAALLYWQGTLPDAVYWTIVNHGVPRVFWRRGAEHTLAFAAACLPMLAAAAMAWRDSSWAGKEAERTALVAWAAVSAVGTAAGARFYPHYYIQLIPPLALLAAPVWRRLLAHTEPAPLLRRSIARSWIALTVVVFSTMHWYGLAGQRSPSDAALYVRSHSAPDDRLFVWGQAASIYLDADRRPASRYITSFALTGFVFGGSERETDTRSRIVPGAWQNLESDFGRHPPAFIVDAQNDPAVGYRLGDFPALGTLIARRYHLVAHASDGDIYELNGHPARTRSTNPVEHVQAAYFKVVNQR